jgi:hypothetical protein
LFRCLDGCALGHQVGLQPGLWLLIVIFYPLASVYPQELLFRAFDVRGELFGGDGAEDVQAGGAAAGEHRGQHTGHRRRGDEDQE